MKPLLLAIILVGLALIGIIWYRSHTSDLQVDPHARQEIEKAKAR